MPYQITVKSADITQDYNGEDITVYIVNADETDVLVVVNTVINNTSDEQMILGEYVVPKLDPDMQVVGENFEFELSEEALSKKLAPGVEVELDFVFITNTNYTDDNGTFYLSFEGFTDNQKTFRIPSN